MKKFLAPIAITACVLCLAGCSMGSEPTNKITDPLPDKVVESEVEEETTEAEEEKNTEATTEKHTKTDEELNQEYEEWKAEALKENEATEEQTTETTKATTEETTEATTEEITQEPTTNAGQEPTTTAGDLGILSIPDAGIDVGLYSDANAFQASGKASVQYYTQYGIKWIADHVNQDGFWNLKYLSVGDKVYINDHEYTVVDSVYAADYYSNFNAWVSYIDESPLVLQTCEGDGARLIKCQ